MPTYDSAKQEITVLDSKIRWHRYIKGKSLPWTQWVDGTIFLNLGGTMLWKSDKLKDGMRADKLPNTVVIAEDNDQGEGSRHCFEWVLSE